MRTIIIIFMMIIAVPSALFGAEENEYELKCYPENLKVGDMAYILITCRNDTEKDIHVQLPQQTVRYPTCYATINMNNGIDTWQFAFEIPGTDLMKGNAGYGNSPSVIIAPHDKKVILCERIQFPPLEDLHEPFWEKIIGTLSTKGKEIKLTANLCAFRVNTTMSKTIKLSCRSPEEMDRINERYQYMSQQFGLVREVVKNPIFSVAVKTCHSINKTMETPSHSEHPDLFGVIPLCIATGNRYTGFPTCPTTWQGWKELEEGLTPSTMRDEIRLTRICIQYCDTKDDAVLKELKTWFDTMNKIQRTVMAKTLCDRAKNSIGEERIFPQLREIYLTICEYDTVPRTKEEQKMLEIPRPDR